MVTLAKKDSSWSPWYQTDDDAAKAVLPHKPGVYEIRSDFEFGRVKGRSSLVSIGSAKDSLYKRLCEQRFGDWVRYMNRAEKWLVHEGHILEFHYLPVDTEKEARLLEAERLFAYECEHGELPPGNEVLPQSIIKQQIEERYGGRSAEKVIRELLREHQSLEQVASALGTTKEVVHSLTVFWGIKVAGKA